MVELTPLPLIVAANAFVGKPWAMGATSILCGFSIVLVALYGAADIAGEALMSGNRVSTRYAADAGIIVTAFAASSLVVTSVRKRLATMLPIDPEHPVHTLALVLATLLLGIQISMIAFTDVLASNLEQPPLSIADLLEGELPFVIIAFAGVGLFIRRSVYAATDRLGVVRPAWWHIVLGLAAAGVFLAFAVASDAISHSTSPEVARRVDTTTQHLFSGLSNPLGIAAIGILPGVCEELLFRGALQPRLGLIFTALLFTAIHTEYGLSVITFAVFVLAIGLGLLRKYTNTTTSCTCHVTYNLLVGVGIPAAVLNAAVAAEVALIAASAYGIWSHRRRIP